MVAWVRAKIMIRIWKYEAAPQDLKELEPKASAGWWVLESPPELAAEVEGVMPASHLSEISRHQLPDGTAVFFGRSLSHLLHSVRESQEDLNSPEQHSS